MPVIPVFRKQRQVDLKFKISLSYVAYYMEEAGLKSTQRDGLGPVHTFHLSTGGRGRWISS